MSVLRITEGLARISVHPLLAAVCRVFFGLRLKGTRFLPPRGAGLVVANHQGYLDPLFLQMAVTRPIRYMMTSDFYDVPWARPFFRFVGAIRVAEGRQANRAALDAAFEILGRGGLVGIFPEGRLSVTGAIGKLMPGVTYLAARSGAPVIPARITGSIHVLPRGRWLPRFGRVEVRFAPPLTFYDAKDRSAVGRIRAAWGAE